MTQRIMKKKAFYTLIMVGSFGLTNNMSLAMDKDNKVVVTRSEDRYVLTAKQNVKNAEKIQQPNLTTIKRHISNTERDLTSIPFVVHDDSLIYDEDNIVESTQKNSIKLSDDLKKTSQDKNRDSFIKQSEKRKQHQSIIAQEDKQKEIKALKFQQRKEKEEVVRKEKEAARIKELNIDFKAADDFELVTESPKKPKVEVRKRSKTFSDVPRKTKSSSETVYPTTTFNNDDFYSGDTVKTPVTSKKSFNKDKRVTRATGEYPTTAPENLYNAELVGQDNLTPFKRDIKNLEKKAEKK